MKLTLYDLEDSYINVLELLEEDENTDLQNVLGQISEQFELKAENIAKLIKELDGESKTLAEEIKRLQAKKNSKDNNVKRLKLYLEDAMKTTGKTKFKTDLFSFGVQRNRPSLDIQNEDNIPQDYMRITKAVDKRELLEAIQNGLEVAGVSIKQTESLRIR